MPDKKSSENREDVRIYNPQTAEWESGHEVAQMHSAPDPVAEHLAQVEGDVAPGDRNAEELAQLDPADAGPVVTAGQNTGVAPAADAGPVGAGATGGAARGGAATGGRAAAGGGGGAGNTGGA